VSFLPFYIPQRKKLSIVIVGGGYAGIAALTTLVRYMPDANITIIDPRSHHVKITHLHESFRYPLQDFMVPFSSLEERFGCRHICAELHTTEDNIQQWRDDKFITINEEKIEFDYVLVASGAASGGASQNNNVHDINTFLTISGSELINRSLEEINQKKPYISVVGGGATGIQFLFEIAHFIKRKKIECNLRLIHSNDRVLQQFPAGFSKYTEARMSDLGIDFQQNTYYQKQTENSIILKSKETKEEFELPSKITFLFLGNNPGKRLSANTFGQFIIDSQPIRNIFIAGDCSNYNSCGSNTMSAQSSVRKGRLAACNILRDSGILKIFEPYLHQDLGYVISLGPKDAVGWLAVENNVVSGTPALLLKELVEAQYDLLLAKGINTYLM
jgi:NADH:ubiquinone reductase (H+-translocating)